MDKKPQNQTGKVNYIWVLAGGYLVYLGAQLLFGVDRSDTPVIGLAGGLFFVAFGGWTMFREWKAYKYGLEHIDDPDSWSDEEVLPEEEAPQQEPTDGEDGV